MLKKNNKQEHKPRKFKNQKHLVNYLLKKKINVKIKLIKLDDVH